MKNQNKDFHFLYICNMATIVIDIDSGTDKKRLLEALQLFKGVKDVHLLNDDDLENISLLKACKDARKSKKVSKEDILKEL
ncbi:hypothetical protein [Anaerophaga thermohalophila]|uniref:hypothetical protein n=1 Tax=Anaerophaga thermohalophila TaxID=177400 RepID=UPI001146CE34|nr:hypothetical protein [Anaerophaga thermohalophila]